MRPRFGEKFEEATTLTVQFEANRDINHFNYLSSPRAKPMIDCDVKTGPTINHNHKYRQKTSVNKKDVVVVFGMINHNQDHDHLSSANNPATTKKLIYNLHKFDEDTLWLILEWNSSIKL